MRISAKYVLVALVGACLCGGAAVPGVAAPSGSATPAGSTVKVRPGVAELNGDIEVSRLVYDQEMELLTASQAVEDCLYGRRNFAAARTVVQKCLRNGDNINNNLTAYQSAHPSALGQAAVQLWAKRRTILDKMQALLAKGKIERPELRTFEEQSGDLTQAVVVKWLGAKAQRANEGIKQAPSQRARDYYAWQVQAIAAQKQLCITHQHLLELTAAAANGKRISAKEAREIKDTLAKLEAKVRAVEVPGMFREANKALANEIACQGRFAEATMLLASDSSEDSVNRLERCNKSLRKASVTSAKAALEALKSLK